MADFAFCYFSIYQVIFASLLVNGPAVVIVFNMTFRCMPTTVQANTCRMRESFLLFVLRLPSIFLSAVELGFYFYIF